MRYQLEQMRIKRNAALVLAIVLGLFVVFSSLLAEFRSAHGGEDQPLAPVSTEVTETAVTLVNPD